MPLTKAYVAENVLQPVVSFTVLVKTVLGRGKQLQKGTLFTSEWQT